MPRICSQTTDTSIELYWHDGLLHSKPSGTPPSVHVPAIEDFVARVARQLGAHEAALATEVIDRNASAHFVGGAPIGESSETGAVDAYLRMFGQPGIDPIMPHRPFVPAGAPGELRFDATTQEVIPAHPFVPYRMVGRR